MTAIEELKRRVLLKNQLITWAQEDVREIEKKIKELETQHDHNN